MIFNKIIKEESMVLELVFNAFQKNKNLLLSCINQHCFNIYCENLAYRQLLDNHFSIHMDGMGIFWASKIFGIKNVELYNGTDLNEKIISYLGESNIPLYIIGGRFSQEEMQDYSNKKGLKFAGYQNGFFNESDVEKIIQKIDNSKTQAVLIGMGVPKQELLAFKLSKGIDVNLIHCVGNFFEFSLGKKLRVPKLLRNKGIEWSFRLITEPRRLWRRYLLGIPVFFFNVIKEYFRLHK